MVQVRDSRLLASTSSTVSIARLPAGFADGFAAAMEKLKLERMSIEASPEEALDSFEDELERAISSGAHVSAAGPGRPQAYPAACEEAGNP